MATATGSLPPPFPSPPPPSGGPGAIQPSPDIFSPPPPPILSPEDFAKLPHDNASGRLLAVIWPLIGFSAIFLSLRVYCKFLRHNRLWWDDYILIGSWCCITVTSCCLTVGVARYNYGVHVWDWVGTPADTANFFLLINVAGTFSLVAAIWSKTSFAFTLLRLTEGWMKWLVWYIIISMNIAMGLSALFNWVQCQPVYKSWDPLAEGTCWPYSVVVYYNVFSAAYSATMDLTLAFLPWKIIWGLQMKRKEKAGVVAAMSMGVIAGILGFVKTSKVPAMLSLDMYDGVDLFIWGNAESSVTIIAASIPVLRVLVRDVRSSARGYTASSSGGRGSTGTGAAGPRRQSSAGVVAGPQGAGGRRGSQNNIVTITARHRVDTSQSDKSILRDDPSSGSPARILRTNEVAVEYQVRRDTSSDDFELGGLRRNKEIC